MASPDAAVRRVSGMWDRSNGRVTSDGASGMGGAGGASVGGAGDSGTTTARSCAALGSTTISAVAGAPTLWEADGAVRHWTGGGGWTGCTVRTSRTVSPATCAAGCSAGDCSTERAGTDGAAGEIVGAGA